MGGNGERLRKWGGKWEEKLGNLWGNVENGGNGGKEGNVGEMRGK